MLVNNSHCGYDIKRLYEIGEQDKFDTFELRDGYAKIITDEEKECLNVLVCICNYLTEMTKYESSYREWILTSHGVILDPDAVVFDHAYNKVMVDINLFKNSILEGMVSDQVKEVKKGIMDIKDILKKNGLDHIIDIKPAVVYENTSKTKPIKNSEEDDEYNYFSQKVVIGRMTINLNTITSVVKGLFRLLGTKNYLFDESDETLFDRSVICRVK